MKKKLDYHLEDPTWCNGCGIYAIFDALKSTAVSLKIEPEQLVIVTGIGCHGRLNNYFKAYGFHSLHGRVLPVATGIKLSNPELHVVAVSGDGDAYSIGMGHFIHSLRRNISITYLVVDNRIFALTQGQTSPTSRLGFVSNSSPYGSREYPLDGPQLALAAGGTYIARGYSGEPSRLAALIKGGMSHKGFALIDVLSPCVTQNKVNTYTWFKKNIYYLEEDSSFNPRDKRKAWERTSANGKIPVGLIYQEEKPSFEELVLPDREKPLVFNDLKISIKKFNRILEKFK
ncbi:MAG: 2-oxoacid:ferredoxin oxidoreductase subunit beta [Candidatus Aminicenantes bacterium]|nr:2-oxoacid:ferredoxin oxidoreductase subunit beta [Candidatus Aminicenantes bacterium]MBL7081997.1 2-oxoacid:ferredoxin oxidoreductase subunit beta [Candidatus Aminicenantes bacterium]